MPQIRSILKIFIIVLFLFPSLVFASQIVLKSGQKIEGKIVEQTDKYLKIDSGIGVPITYYADEIDTVDGQKLQPTLIHSISSVSSTNTIDQVNSQDRAQDINSSMPQTPQPVENSVQTVGDISLSEGIERAEVLLGHGDYDGALAIFNTILDKNPNNVKALLGRAYCFKNQGKYDLGLQDCNRIIQLYPQTKADLNKLMGDLYLGLKDGVHADPDFEEYLWQHPKDGESYYGRAMAEYYEHLYSDSLDNLNKATALGAEDAQGLADKLNAIQDGNKRYQTEQEKINQKVWLKNLVRMIFLIPILLAGIYAFFKSLLKGDTKNTNVQLDVKSNLPTEKPATPSAKKGLLLAFIAGTIINVLIIFLIVGGGRLKEEGFAAVFLDPLLWIWFVGVYVACLFVIFLIYGIMTTMSKVMPK